MDTSGNLKCPAITVWVLFTLNIFLNYQNILVIGIIFYSNIIKLTYTKIDINNKYNNYNNDKYNNYYNFYGNMESYINFIFSSLIINCVIELIASILVSLSLEMRKFRLYLIGLIMSLIFDIYMTTYIIISSSKEFEIFFKYEDIYNQAGLKFKGKGSYIFNIIFQILIQWIQSVVLIIYFKKVKQSFNKSYLNPVLITDVPNQIQPSE